MQMDEKRKREPSVWHASPLARLNRTKPWAETVGTHFAINTSEQFERFSGMLTEYCGAKMTEKLSWTLTRREVDIKFWHASNGTCFGGRAAFLFRRPEARNIQDEERYCSARYFSTPRFTSFMFGVIIFTTNFSTASPTFLASSPGTPGIFLASTWRSPVI